MDVADHWFDVTELGDGITHVIEPHVRGLLRGNIWWVHGDKRDVVVDTGMGIGSLPDAVPAMFEHRPLAVVTHTHLDHVGGAADFPEVAVHEAEAAALGEPAQASLVTGRLLDLLGLRLDDAELAGLPELQLTALPEAGYDLHDYAVRPAGPGRALRDGDLLDLGGRALRVLHLPGHTPGSIVLHDEDAGALYSGDVVYDDELLDELVGSDIPAYVASLRRLRELPVTTVYPGHGDPFGVERLHEIIDGYLAKRDP